MEDLIKRVEALLFAVGRAISDEELARLSGTSVSQVQEALKDLKKEYVERGSPLLIIQEGNGWKLTVHEKYLSLVQQINPHTELSKAILETLAVIAWKHPAKQSDVIKIRTNKAYEHIDELERLGFIAKEKYGRTYLLKVTGKFFDYFDLAGEKGVREIFKDVKGVEEAQTKLLDQEIEKEVGFEVYEAEKEEKEAPKEHLGKLEVFEEIEEEGAKEEEAFEERGEPEIPEAAKEKEEEPVEMFLKEHKQKPAPQEFEEEERAEEAFEEKSEVSEEETPEEAEEEERELEPELEEMISKEKQKKKSK